MTLEHLAASFLKLKRASTKFGMAPHKPVLLISLLDLMDSGEVMDNHFIVNSDLVAVFHQNWTALVFTSHQEDFTQPFYYLQNDKVVGRAFWKLIPKAGFSINSHIKSIHVLSDVLEFGSFSEEVYLVLADSKNRAVLRDLLLDHYFPVYRNAYYSSKKSESNYLRSIDSYVLNESDKIQRLQVAEEEWVYVRSGFFKKWIPKIYQNTCAISQMKLVSTFGYSLIDACHIRPFSDNQDDRVTNGIALCPNLHRAFDRGLISIDKNYRVLVTDQIQEDVSNPYGLGNLKGKKILLPSENHLWPDQENLEWHRYNSFKG